MDISRGERLLDGAAVSFETTGDHNHRILLAEDRSCDNGVAVTAAAAKAFLSQNPVTENLVYLIVETPEGCFGRDISGM